MRSTREDLISDVSDLKDKLSKIESSIENKEKIIEDLVPRRDASKKALVDRYRNLDKEATRLFNAQCNKSADLQTADKQIFEMLDIMKQDDELSNDEVNLVKGSNTRTTYFKSYCDLLKAEDVIELLSPFLVKAKQEEEKLKKKSEELASARERAMKDADAQKSIVVSMKKDIAALRAAVHDEVGGAFVAVKRQKGDDEARYGTRAILDGTYDGFVDDLVLYKEKQKDLLKAEDILEKLKEDIGKFEVVSRGLEGDQNDTTACIADLEKSIKKATDGAAEVKATYPELDSKLDIVLKGVDITGELECYIKKRSEMGKSVNRTINEVSKRLKTQPTITSTQTFNAINLRDVQLEMQNMVKLHPWIVEEARSTDPRIIKEASSTSRKRKPDSLYSSANERVEDLSGDVAERIKIAENDLQQLKSDKEKIEGEISAWSTMWDDVFRVLEKDFVETSKGLLPDFKSIELVATEKGLDVTCDENVVNMACLDNRAHKLSLSLLLGMCNPTQSSITFLDRIDAHFNADDILLIKDTLTRLFPNQQFILMAKNMVRHQSLVSLSVEPSEPSY